MLKYQEVTKEGLKRFISPCKKVLGNFNLELYKNILGSLKIPKKTTKITEKKEIKEERIQLKEEIFTKKKSNYNGVIKLSSVSKSFGANNVLNNIDLAIPKGKILGLVGISGSGKTTLLKMIVGFYRPTKGNIFLDGKDILKHNKAVKSIFGFGSQENCFYGRLNAEENVKYFAELYGLTDDYINTRLDSVLKLVGLYDSRKTLGENLSTGMKRRLDIACSLIHDPDIVILDEPTEDLDLNLRKEILSLIRRINKDGKTVIMTSHLLGEVENICDNVGILSNGKIVEFGSPETLKQEYSKNFEIHLQTNSGKYNSILKGINAKKIIKKGKGVVLYVPDGEKTLNYIMKKSRRNKDKIVSLKLSRPSLSEIFESYTKNAK